MRIDQMNNHMKLKLINQISGIGSLENNTSVDINSYTAMNGSKYDLMSISDDSKRLKEAQSIVTRLIKIDDSPIKKMMAQNNNLKLLGGSYGECSINGLRYVFKLDKHGHVTVPFENIGIDSSELSDLSYKELDKVGRFYTYLARDKSAYLALSSYSRQEVMDMLSSVGIKPGFFSVESDESCNEFCLLEDGTLYPKYQSDAHRLALNTTNYFKEGYTSESIFRVDGKEYKLDSNGYLDIPESAMCLTETIEKIK